MTDMIKQKYRINDLVKIAKRVNNNKRKYLFVNPIQGKHIPVDPKKAYNLFNEISDIIEAEYSQENVMVVAFAETATAVGAVAASALNVKYYVHTTRENVNTQNILRFSEVHSHAKNQCLVVDGIEKIAQSIDRIVFIDDEVTTGNTILKLIDAIKENTRQRDYSFGIVSILNSMTDERIMQLEKQGISCRYICRLPYEYKADRLDHYKYCDNVASSRDDRYKLNKEDYIVIEGKVQGNVIQKKEDYFSAINNFCNKVATQLTLSKHIKKVAIIGTEEFMFTPLKVALALSLKYPEKEIKFHATTRSPICTCDSIDYPINSGVRLESVYDSERETYLYNIGNYDLVIVITDADIVNEVAINQLIDAFVDKGCNLYKVIRWVN